jgi:hypothetical protein
MQQDLPDGNYIDLKKQGVKEKANTLREMKVAFRCSNCLSSCCSTDELCI